MDDKKKMTPHKGGRSHRITVRITPEVKKRLEEITNEKGITPADVIEILILKSKI